MIDRENVRNLQACIVPFISNRDFKNDVILIREKNDYAPFEKEIINNSGLKCDDSRNPIYFVVNWNDLCFAPFICYELTDIRARGLVRGEAQLLVVSEYNKDIPYFSNIVESTARDLFCFVAQCNSSDAGDTRLVGPFKEPIKTVFSISGGETDSVHIGEIQINDLNDYLEKYAKCENDKNFEAVSSGDDEKYSDPVKKFKKPSARYKN